MFDWRLLVLLLVSLSALLVLLARRRTPRLPFRPRSWWRRHIPFPPSAGIFLLTLCLTGCDKLPLPSSWRPTLEQVGLAPEQPKPRLLIDGLLDTSLASPGLDKDTFRSAVRATAEAAASSPGSIVRWTILGPSVDTMRVLGEKVSPSLPRRGTRAVSEAKERFVREVTELMMTAAAPALSGKPLRSSPLIGAFGRLAIADTHGIEQRVILALSDGREMSELADLECLPLKKFPTAPVWERDTARQIPLGSLKNAQVFFAYSTVSPTLRTGRCPESSVERTLRTQELMRSALTHSGATRVVFASGLPELLPAPGSPLAVR